MIIIPKDKVKIWCESCKGSGQVIKESKYMECEKCSSRGYLEKNVTELILLKE